MPVTLASTIIQANRTTRTNANTDSFYYLVESEDINYAIEKMICGEVGCEPIDPLPGQKFLILSFSRFDPRSSMTQDIDINDIIMWDGDQWVTYLNTRNSKTPFGLIFDKQTKKFYHYVDEQTGWLPILRSGSVDGGTFGGS